MTTDDVVANLHKQIEEKAKLFEEYPEERIKFLQEVGVLDENGKLSKDYMEKLT